MKTITLNRLPNYPFDVAEAINQLRVNLSFTDADMKRLVVTSSIPAEGKSTITFALWRAMAGIGKKTLYIDCDMRLSRVQEDYQMSCDDVMVGLPHYLSGQSEFKDVIYKTNVTNGYMIPVSSLVNNPTILIENHRFHELMESVYELFDYIIIDTPPLGAVADALTVCKSADASILVVGSGIAKKRMVKESVEKLRVTGKPMLGIVLNQVDTSSHGSYYNQGYGAYYQAYDPESRKK